MGRFVDEYAPPELPGYPCISVPQRKTKIVTIASGDESAEQIWQYSKRIFTLPKAVRKYEHFYAVLNHWEVMDGPASTWPFRDPLDYASVASPDPYVPPTTSYLDMPLGTGDGVTTTFQITKRYTRGARTHSRPVYVPVVATIEVAVNGVNLPAADSPTLWTVAREGGIVTFDTAPAEGAVLTWGGLFDCNVRFENDDAFAGLVQNYHVNGYADLTLIEVPLCTDDD